MGKKLIKKESQSSGTQIPEVTKDNYYDMAQALYWICTEWHDGQWSTMYQILSELEYRPASSENGVDEETSPEGRAVYDALNSLCETNYKEAERVCEDIKNRIFSVIGGDVEDNAEEVDVEDPILEGSKKTFRIIEAKKKQKKTSNCVTGIKESKTMGINLRNLKTAGNGLEDMNRRLDLLGQEMALLEGTINRSKRELATKRKEYNDIQDKIGSGARAAHEISPGSTPDDIV